MAGGSAPRRSTLSRIRSHLPGRRRNTEEATPRQRVENPTNRRTLETEKDAVGDLFMNGLLKLYDEEYKYDPDKKSNVAALAKIAVESGTANEVEVPESKLIRKVEKINKQGGETTGSMADLASGVQEMTKGGFNGGSLAGVVANGVQLALQIFRFCRELYRAYKEGGDAGRVFKEQSVDLLFQLIQTASSIASLLQALGDLSGPVAGIIGIVRTAKSFGFHMRDAIRLRGGYKGIEKVKKAVKERLKTKLYTRFGRDWDNIRKLKFEKWGTFLNENEGKTPPFPIKGFEDTKNLKQYIFDEKKESGRGTFIYLDPVETSRRKLFLQKFLKRKQKGKGARRTRYLLGMTPEAWDAMMKDITEENSDLQGYEVDKAIEERSAEVARQLGYDIGVDFGHLAGYATMCEPSVGSIAGPAINLATDITNLGHNIYLKKRQQQRDDSGDAKSTSNKVTERRRMAEVLVNRMKDLETKKMFELSAVDEQNNRINMLKSIDESDDMNARIKAMGLSYDFLTQANTGESLVDHLAVGFFRSNEEGRRAVHSVPRTVGPAAAATP